MQLLKDLLQKVDKQSIKGKDDKFIGSIAYDSRKAIKNSLFIAIKGIVFDSHEFIEEAIQSGSVAVVCEEFPKKLNNNITYIKVNNSRKCLGIISSNFFNKPSNKLKIIGVTGTNGKTTITTLLFNLFRSLNYKCGLISTIENRINDEIISTNSTTPDSYKINELFNEMVNSGCEFCFMEVSSHGIKQDRIFGINFSFAVFTNISRDHLDYHKSLEDYILTKKKFFDDLESSSIAIVNKDDIYSEKMVSDCKAKKIYYSINSSDSDYQAEIINNDFNGLKILIDHHILKTNITGYFNVYNLLAIYCVATRIYKDKFQLLKSLSGLKNILGRFNIIKNKKGINAIVDYAHSPGAIESVFHSILKIKDNKQKIITVIGCGGNRDIGKRPLMGNISYYNSDTTIFTSDNPRDEDIMKIINEMCTDLNELEHKQLIKIPERAKAIERGVRLAKRNDIVLILGKGHEKYQEIKGVKYPFDDYEVLRKILK